jgi:intracellular multiplication protein IcmJ
MQHQIQLSLNEKRWRLFMVRREDKHFKSFADQVLKRDQHRCRYCGFQARSHQEIVNLDEDFNNNRLSNLVTACRLCAQCFFIEMIGKMDFGGGVVVHLPEIEQSQLNALCHVLFCSISSENDFQSTAQSLYNSLKIRSKAVERDLGKGLSNPSFLGQMMIDTPLDNKEHKRNHVLKDLRILPLHAKFTQELKDWSKDTVANPKEG